MNYKEECINDKVAYVLPIGDIHIGDASFKQYSLNKLQGYIKWIKDNKNSRVVLGGDIFNVGTRESKTSPFNQKDNEFEIAVKLFEPIKSQIVAAISGNHEQRLEDFANYDLMNAFCQRLGIFYMKYSGVVAFKVGKYVHGYRQFYPIYFHHTTGGGMSAGGSLNRVEKLTNMVWNCDAYCGFHSHKLATATREIYYPSHESKEMKAKRVSFLSCGSYLEWNGYPEMKMLPPEKLGSPRIRLDGRRDHHDLHCSI